MENPCNYHTHTSYLVPGLRQVLNKNGSDIDILVEFKGSPSLLTLIRLENELSEILSTKVDLVTIGALKNKRIKKSIEKDLINIL